MRLSGKEYKDTTRKRTNLANDRVSSCSAAARLKHICITSANWKILQENQGGGRGRRSGERGKPSADSFICNSTSSLCVNYVSLCGQGAGLPCISPAFYSPPFLASFCGSHIPSLPLFAISFVEIPFHQSWNV